jgi:hypothetical protein
MYLPWIGYFGLIEAADVFVYYDDVQFVRRSWQRRNRIKIPDGEFTYVTVTVQKDFGQNIHEVTLKDDGWRNKHWQSIRHSYASTPYFDEYANRLQSIYDQRWERLVELNTAIIDELCEALDITTEFRYASNVDVSGNKTDRLIDILKEIDADEYISGPGAKEYIQSSKFNHAGIDLYWHDFPHPKYDQIHGEFISHLSSIDLLFHEGPAAGDCIREAETEALVLEN